MWFINFIIHWLIKGSHLEKTEKKNDSIARIFLLDWIFHLRAILFFISK